MTAPDFLLSRAHGSVRTQGSTSTYDDPWLAAERLRRGEHEMVVGAIPFNPDHPAALTVPEHIIRSEQPLEPPAHYRWHAPEIRARIVAEDPPPEEHLERVAAATRTIAHSGLEKIVLARALDIVVDPPMDPLLLAARLLDGSPNRDGFVADLSPAGGRFAGSLLIGSSPEMLVRRNGLTVEAFPLAGSAPRSRNRAEDEAAAAKLRASRKNNEEHAFVVDDIADSLEPLCSWLEVPEEPVLLSTSEMHHLGTPIRGELRDPIISALDLALIVHPTPAICGTPTESAMGVIEAVETDRGFYAGAVGWCDAAGDGEFVVAIRCAEVSEAGDRVRTWGGGGIVADSDPGEEVAETSAKLRTVLRALGL
ncbi:isochorismate synthase MenF [Corynebacterium sp.]|uniref:isochorismate synthase n=1 Tax=Corynebacterium sp. TaxID=1720 RepID=UPI0026DBB45F|nr:isochorismate synthase [Corynebacterium sp.]MDO4610065.1 isochorismate synthase [Corynebacterium sp.]